MISRLFAAALCLAAAVPAHAQFDELAQLIPSSANVIVLLDAGRILDSKMSKDFGWRDKFEEAFAAGLISVSPDTRRLVLASQFDFEQFKSQWELAVADLGRPRSAAELARVTKGVLDPLGDMPAVALRDDAYAIELKPNRLAAMTPANRQAVVRWLREAAKRPAPALSPYLTGSLIAVEKSPLVIAFDLEDAVPPDILRIKLSQSAALKDSTVNLDAAVKALQSLRGLVFEAAIGEGAHGRVMVHFQDDASALDPIAKALLLEVLGNRGVAFDDLKDWKQENEPQKITFIGTLSASGRRRILSLVNNPLASLVAVEHEASYGPEKTPESAARASQVYFKSVASILNDVREQSGQAMTFGQNAQWFDLWARKIDKLPVLHVDPDLVGFGSYCSEQLRNMSSAMRGIGINSGERTAGLGNYYSDVRIGNPERFKIQAQERASGALNARNIARDVENSAAKIRKQLTQKYQVEF